MRLVVDQRGEASLLDAADLRRFKLVIEDPAMPLERVRDALRGIANVDDRSTAWVSEAALRTLGDRADDPEWQHGVTGMIGMAAKHGWVDAQSGAIRVHIEWAPAAS